MNSKSTLFDRIAAIVYVIPSILAISRYGSSILSLAVDVLFAFFMFKGNRKIPFFIFVVCVACALPTAFYSPLLLLNLIKLLIMTILFFPGFKGKEVSPKMKKIWFVPGILQLIPYLSNNYITVPVLVRYIAALSSTLILCYWAVMATSSEDEKKNGASSTPEAVEGYYDLPSHLVFLICTLGIWYFVWIYKTTEFMNKLPNEKQKNPTTELLLCMLVPFYSIFWMYKTAQKTERFAIYHEMNCDISAKCLLFAIITGIIPAYIIQEKINDALTSGGNFEYEEPSSPVTAEDDSSDIGDINTYEDLYKSGIISEEEYNEKLEKYFSGE